MGSNAPMLHCGMAQEASSAEMLKECIRDTDTSAISLKAGSITEKVVTEALRELFAEKTVRLGIRNVNVALSPAGTRHGSKRYQMQLVDAPGAELESIVSEGEHRCLAIAGFLTELATSPLKSALVFDDPVSSLDHLHRGSLAKRLAEEALVRQVIVFTHDLVFAFFLDKIAHTLGIEPFQQFVIATLSMPV
jgi:wobble nucleotide-excising tRNase